MALSYGERGESGDLWNEPGQTVENVKRVRHEQAEEAARAIGARLECWDLGDYPLRLDEGTVERLADAIREFAPDVILTHSERDPFNRTTRWPTPPCSAQGSWPAGPGWRAPLRPSNRRAALLRAAPAGAVRLPTEHVRGHHRRLRAQA